jgi:ribosomal protein S18 acetylase RimI-like enzyme
LQATSDYKVALNWASELLGELNVPRVFIGAENFLEGFRVEDSFSFTTKGDMPYGQAYGPHPHIDPRWEKVAVAYGSGAPTFGHLQIANQFDFYGRTTAVITGFEELEICTDDVLIERVLKENAPHSSVYPGNSEIVFWGQVDNAAFGALVKWKSGFHVLVSIVTVEAMRGKGLATELTKRMVSKAAQLGIEEVALGVAHKNIGAIKAYEKAGFKELAQFTNYYLEPSLQSKH